VEPPRRWQAARTSPPTRERTGRRYEVSTVQPLLAVGSSERYAVFAEGRGRRAGFREVKYPPGSCQNVVIGHDREVVVAGI
jgi:hypothetical protein